MFDTNKVASNIKNARMKKNMTQMNLADEMGVSYQAVSNWERGNSMPDISKLPELCKILEISFEELVGERTAETDIAEKLMEDENADVTLEELAQVGELVKPEQIESKVNEEMRKGKKIPFLTLVSLAPFMDRETLDKMAEEIADIDLKRLCLVAPFLKRDTMDRIVDKSIQNGQVSMSAMAGIAPFLSKATVNKVAEYLIANGQANKLVLIAPFMGKEMFPSHLGDISFGVSEKSESISFSTDMDLDEMDEEDVAKVAFAALEQGKDVAEYLDYMDEADVGKLALRALELGRKTEVFLDYMDEDAVEMLAFKALEAGKDVECYLDYMDDDVIRKLLLKAVKK